MIVLDTNVLSEIMRPQPSNSVVNWLNDQNPLELFVTTITLAEIGYGLKILPKGQKRWQLEYKFTQYIDQGFAERILDFTEVAAHHYAEIMSHRKHLGRPMSLPDGQIAAIARSKSFKVATRNIKDFEECGSELINPFEY